METAQTGRYKCICFTDNGAELMKKMCDEAEKAGEEKAVYASAESLGKWTADNFHTGNVLIFIGAMGIAVRAIAPYIEDKSTDPAVIVIDEKGMFVIPVLSGHLGGAVKAAGKIADLIGGTPVITTATDVNGEFAVDVFASDNALVISDMKKARSYTACLLRNKRAFYRIDERFREFIHVKNMPLNIRKSFECCGFIISPGIVEGEMLQLIPKSLVVGMGCRKGMSKEALKKFCLESLEKNGLDKRAVKAVVSADIKKDETGLFDLSEDLDAEFKTYSTEILERQKGEFSASDFVKSITGVDNVCERAVMAYGAERLLVKKISFKGMTFSVGIMDVTIINMQ